MKTLALTAATALFCTGLTSLSAADTYQLDPAHAAALFTVSHLGYSNTWGRFNGVAGSVTWDDANPANSSVSVTIKTDTIDTGTAKKDEHLRSGDFFSVKEFPELTFVSKEIKPVDGIYHVTGDLTLKGVSKTITIPVKKVGAGKDPWGKDRIGFDSSFTIKRSDYGLNFMPDGIGDDVTITFAVEGVK